MFYHGVIILYDFSVITPCFYKERVTQNFIKFKGNNMKFFFQQRCGTGLKLYNKRTPLQRKFSRGLCDIYTTASNYKYLLWLFTMLIIDICGLRKNRSLGFTNFQLVVSEDGCRFIVLVFGVRNYYFGL